MKMLWFGRVFAVLGIFALWTPVMADDDDDDDSSTARIEEVLVYGQRVESTVSDTSIAITAMDQDFLEDMGVQGPNEMINFIPATTRTAWDIKIRGVGRNFRGLGGDPGVGTYYNGIYSPDFGIAATENALYDIKRVEVLRGPQGTLYGRNSIGGVINYVTNQPQHEETSASIRMAFGQHGTNEWAGWLSGPLTDPTKSNIGDIAYRLVVTDRNRDGALPGHAGTQDLDDTNDRNYVLTLDWILSDKLSINLRGNDRHSIRAGNFGNGGTGIASEGPCVGVHPITSNDQCDPRYRVNRDINHYSTGFRPVDQGWFDRWGDLADDPRGAVPWIHPSSGATFYGAYNRPGVDPAANWPYMPSQCYMNPDCASYDIGSQDEPNIVALTTNDGSEEFIHNAGSLTVDFEINENVALRYLGNYQSFMYYFNRDVNVSNGHTSDIDDTVIAQTESRSHELRLFWQVGENWTATSGIYTFWESRDQWYGIRERAAQGRAINPAIYGPEGWETFLTDSLAVVGWIVPGCMNWGGTLGNDQAGQLTYNDATHPGYGSYCGDPGRDYPFTGHLPGRLPSHEHDTGALYEHRNYIDNDSAAFYTQGDLRLTDNFSVTLGMRYSKDWRDAEEQRGGYSEIEANQYGWLPWAIYTRCTIQIAAGGTCPGVADPLQFFGPGVTPLAALNVAMGAATFTNDPTGDFPIAPVCEYTAETCDRPIRLHGIPISWGSRTTGTFKQDGEFTFRVNFNWEPTSDILIYLGMTEGYRAGGFNMGGPDNRSEVDSTGDGVANLRVMSQYDGENITSYELGYKGTHFDGRLMLNLAAYYYDYQNYQDHIERWESESGSFALPDITFVGPDGTEQSLNPPAGRGPVSITTNIPSAHNNGFEVDAVYLLTDALTVGGNMSYTQSQYDAEYTFFNQDDPRYPRAVLGGDLTQDPCEMPEDIRALYCIQVDGLDLTGIPKWKATGWASYKLNLSGGDITLYGALAFTGEYSTNAFNRPWDWVPQRERLDVRATYRANSGKWQTSVFVDNVFDKTFVRTSDLHGRLTGYGGDWSNRVIALYPRYIGMEVTYNFQ